MDPVMLGVFVVIVGVVVAAFFLLGGSRTREQERLNSLAPKPGAPPKPGVKLETPIDAATAERIKKEEKQAKLCDRLDQAGFYGAKALAMFAVFRTMMVVAPALLGLLAARFGYFSMTQGILIGLTAGMIGTLAPSFWLDRMKRNRQSKIRRALPDALDVMVVCLEGGLSFTGAIARVSRELASAHPMLALELSIVERQVRMGSTAGQALRDMARRFDLEELRSMASVVIQSERIGSSIITALSVFAETLRVQRHQRAEAMAHKASVKMMFPTLLCIFPAIFVVILGPAAIKIKKQLGKSAAASTARKK